MKQTTLNSIAYFITLIIGYTLIFIFYDWKLFLIMLFIGMSTNVMVVFNFNKRDL